MSRRSVIISRTLCVREIITCVRYIVIMCKLRGVNWCYFGLRSLKGSTWECAWHRLLLPVCKLLTKRVAEVAGLCVEHGVLTCAYSLANTVLQLVNCRLTCQWAAFGDTVLSTMQFIEAKRLYVHIQLLMSVIMVTLLSIVRHSKGLFSSQIDSSTCCDMPSRHANIQRQQQQQQKRARTVAFTESQ